MKNMLILGAGTGGTLIANILSKKLPKDWRITIIAKSDEHHYQPGYLFTPFKMYGYERRSDITRPTAGLISKRAEFVLAEVKNIDHAGKTVATTAGNFPYDWLVLAMGNRVAPEETEGLEDALEKNAATFYTLDGAIKFQPKLEAMKEGKLVVNVADMPIKCPVAPIEFAFLADYYFRQRGIRDRVEIELVTPLAGAFTKPVANGVLSGLLGERGVKVTPNFQLASVDANAKTITSYTGQKVNYDLLCSVPPNLGPQVLDDSGLGDGAGYAVTHDHTLKSKKADYIFVIGDNTNVHTSKAGSVTHFEAEITADNLLREIAGKEAEPKFDGHSNCFIETGDHKAYLIDFNYEVEPVHGDFPIPGLGPMKLLKNTRINHFGKIAFKWVYWNLLLTGRLAQIPLFPNQMSLKGKNLAEIKAAQR
jgi:sulfide:quinone oxidoreductase